MNKFSPSRPWPELGAHVAGALRPALPSLSEEVFAAVREGVPAYAGSLSGSYGRNIRLGVEHALAGFVELIESGQNAQLPGREVYAALGAGEFREGRTLEALLSAYRAGAQVAWRGLAAAGEAAALPAPVMYRLAEAIFAYIDELSGASAEGYAREQASQAGERETHRRRLVEVLLADPPPAAEDLERAAQAAAWPLPERVAVLAVLTPRPAGVLAALPMGTLAAERGDRLLAVLADPEAPGLPALLGRAVRSAPATLGPGVAPRETGRSARWAQRVLDLAPPGPAAGGPVRIEERLLEVALSSDPEAVAELARRRLAPLDGLTATSHGKLSGTLRAWLDEQGDVGAVARRLAVHPQTVRYRLGRLRELFGSALGDGRARLELAVALEWTAATGAKSDGRR